MIACRNGNADLFVKSLPQGPKTVCSDGGSQLSGGQKQRIAIARALIRNPKILLFDEATSALDTQNKSIVQEALNKAFKDRTVIIVAHKLTTIQNCGCIAVINNGTIVEKGNHNKLINKRGVYYDLSKRQDMSRNN
uniref:ABC transporter domain-containing protein n=1 Tax=Parastrongyloides trichosuri TaxID=131310 RepID=A0A0N4ZBJ1_PARTI